MEQRHLNFCFFGDLHIFRGKQIIDHQSGVQRFLNGRPSAVTLIKVAGKLPQAQGRLKIAFSAANTPQGLFVQLRFTPHKGRARYDRRGDAIAHVLEGGRLPLGPFLLCGDRR